MLIESGRFEAKLLWGNKGADSEQHRSRSIRGSRSSRRSHHRNWPSSAPRVPKSSKYNSKFGIVRRNLQRPKGQGRIECTSTDATRDQRRSWRNDVERQVSTRISNSASDRRERPCNDGGRSWPTRTGSNPNLVGRVAAVTCAPRPTTASPMRSPRRRRRMPS